MSIRYGVVGITVLLASPAWSQPAEISGNRIKAHVKYLASDLLEGRGVGTRGEALTTEYIAAQFALAGAIPAGDNGTYFQSVPLVGVTTDASSQLRATKGGSPPTNFQWRDEFVGSTHRQVEKETVDAEAIFVGHGIDAPDYKWNDYKNSDVKGKVVVLFTNEPQPTNPAVFKGRALTYYGRWTYKFEEAARKGAVGCIIIHTPDTAGYGWEVVRNSWSKEDPQVKLEPGKHALSFAGWITQEAGEKLLAAAGQSVAKLLQASDSQQFQPVPLGIRIQARLTSQMRAINTRNVAAIVPGSDPAAKNEYVILSAHWDHLGIALPVKGDSIYNGAIDNATGVGILLETARAWGALQNKPRRSALFLAYTAEEAGLRGAEYYARNPLVPTAKTALDINYDALFPYGRTKDVILEGAENTSIYPVVQQAARRLEFVIKPSPRPEQGGYYRSDQLMLARIGIPGFRVQSGSEIYGKSASFAAEAFTEYNTQHYHQPSDEYRETWDFAGLEHAAKLGMIIAMDTAQMMTMPAWNGNGEFPAARSERMK